MPAVAFDLDGCLIDSGQAIPLSVRAALAEQGIEGVTDAEVIDLIGPPLSLGFADLLARHGRDPGGADALVAAYRADYREHMLTRTELYPGMADAVRAVAARRACCVVTSKPAALATPILDHLGLLDAFAFVEGPGLAADAEWKEVTLARALDRLPGIAWMVGDRHHDIDAARAHGVGAIGVTWGFGSPEELAGADHVVASPAALVALLAGDPGRLEGMTADTPTPDQKELLLEDSEERAADREAAPDSVVEHRTSDEATPPVD